MSGFYLASYLALWALVLIQMLALAAIYHHFGAIQLNSRKGREAQGPGINSRLDIKPSVAMTLDGEEVHLNNLRQPTLLIFTATTCQPCAALRRHVSDFSARSDVLTLVICGSPDEQTTREWGTSLLKSGVSVIHDEHQRIAGSLGLQITPFLVGIDSSNIVRVKGIANDRATLERSATIVKNLLDLAQRNGAALDREKDVVLDRDVEVSQV